MIATTHHRQLLRCLRTAFSYNNFCRPYSVQKSSQPLRILFAGSDDFSSKSLKALHQEHIQNPSLIASIDVLCREDGRTGRKRDILREVPIKSVARSLELPLHILPSSADWQPPGFVLPADFDLIVAVSFGVFIPADFIEAIHYGGLNVHPSLLPRYRGAAPIQRTLLNHDTETGVTIQTLDKRRFDHGQILMQSPPIPIPLGTRYQTLYHTLAVRGAEMLVETLRRRLFVPPTLPITSPYPSSYARKVTNKDEQVVWEEWTAEEMVLRAEMLGSVWAELGSIIDEASTPRKRVILSGITVLDWAPPLDLDGLEVGCFRYVKQGFEEMMVLRCRDGWVRVGAVKVEGKKEVNGEVWIRGLQMRGVGRKFW